MDDPYGILKAVQAMAAPSPTAGAPGAEPDSEPVEAVPSIEALLAATSSWASTDVGLVGYSSLADALGVPAAGAAAPGASELADETEEQCPQCGGRMHMREHELQCASCQYVAEGDSALTDLADDDAPARRTPQTGRLRIVGPNSGHFQPDLDRSSSTNYAASQRKQIYEEYMQYRQRHIEAGGLAFPINVIELAADNYHEIQKQVTKRSQSKKTIMAYCLQNACIQKGFAPNRAEVAKFMQLPTKGTARGENFVRRMCADGLLTINTNKDTCGPHIVTTFALLGLDGPEESAGGVRLQGVVESIVKKSIADAIAVSSVIRSKVLAAAYVVLHRHALAAKNKPITMIEFCQKCKVRRNTLDRFLTELNAYHSHFEKIYTDAGVFAGPLDHL